MGTACAKLCNDKARVAKKATKVLEVVDREMVDLRTELEVRERALVGVEQQERQLQQQFQEKKIKREDFLRHCRRHYSSRKRITREVQRIEADIKKREIMRDRLRLAKKGSDQDGAVLYSQFVKASRHVLSRGDEEEQLLLDTLHDAAADEEENADREAEMGQIHAKMYSVSSGADESMDPEFRQYLLGLMPMDDDDGDTARVSSQSVANSPEQQTQPDEDALAAEMALELGNAPSVPMSGDHDQNGSAGGSEPAVLYKVQERAVKDR